MSFKIKNKGLRFHAPLTDKYLQTSTLASDISALHNHAHTVNGTPTYSEVGVNLDSGEWVRFSATNVFENKFTVAFRFIPDVPYNINGWLYIFRTTGNYHTILKTNNDSGSYLSISLGGSIIANIPPATYSQYWITGQENTLIWTGDSGAGVSEMWLNGNQILSYSSGWTHQEPADLWIGQTHFDGKIRDLRIYNRIWTESERAVFEEGSVSRHVSSLQKGLFMHFPMTDKWLQSDTMPSDISSTHFRFTTVYGNPPTFNSDGMTLDGSSNINAVWDKYGNLPGATFAVWVKMTDLSGHGSIFCISDTDGSVSLNNYFQFWIDSSGRIRQNYFRLAFDSDSTYTNTGLVTLGNWHHVVLVIVTSSQYYKYYIDGEETPIANASDPPDGNGRFYQYIPGTDLVSIGSRYYNGGIGLHFNGTMNDFRLYHRVLSSSEVAELYKRGPNFV